MPTNDKIDLEKDSKLVNEKIYSGMIWFLLYLATSHFDIMFNVCLCPRFQALAKEFCLTSVKKIFRCLAGTKNLGLWYPQRRDFFLNGYTNADYAGYKVDRKSISGTCWFPGQSLVYWHSKKQDCAALSMSEAAYIATVHVRGLEKKPKPKTESKNRRNRTEKPVNRKNFPKKSVRLTEPGKNFGFRFGYGSGGSKIRLTGG